MLSEDEREQIRRSYYIDHKSVSQTVRKVTTIETPSQAFLEFVGESYHFRQRLRQEEQQLFEGKTETG